MAEVEWPASAASSTTIPAANPHGHPGAACRRRQSHEYRVGVATADDALRIWATVPDKNPLNSLRVINPVALNALATPLPPTEPDPREPCRWGVPFS